MSDVDVNNLRDSAGYSLCHRCKCRVFKDQIYCDACDEMIRRVANEPTHERIAVIE